MNRFAWMRRVALVVAVVLAGCAQMSKVTTGEVVVKERLAVDVRTPWNRFERGMGDNTPTWTTEGMAIDALKFYVGLKDGELIAPTPSGGRGAQPLAFKSAMQPAEIVALYQGLLTRDGSSFTLERLDADQFVGTRGFRFEYALTRKVDDVRLAGVAWGAVRNGELFLVDFSAPRLGFYPRLRPEAEAIARSARVKG